MTDETKCGATYGREVCGLPESSLLHHHDNGRMNHPFQPGTPARETCQENGDPRT